MANANVQDTRPALDDLDSAADALLSRWEDAPEEELSENQDQATDDASIIETDDELEKEVAEDEDTEDDAADPANDADHDEQEELEIDDDMLVEIPVDGEHKQVSVKDLKRLYGQEASLTRKSQELASQRKQADENIQRTSAQLQRMIEKAQERYKPYEEVDMLIASRQMDAQDFAQLRKEAAEAESDVKFLTQEADQFFSQLQAQHSEQQKTAAKEAVKVLEKEMPGWNDSMYNDIRTYAISAGLPEQAVNSFTDPNVIMLLNKARLFDQSKKVATVKKSKVATKVLRSKKAPPTQVDKSKSRQKAAIDSLRSGDANDLDVISNALLARWEQ
jgi:hypothetical protein